MVGKYVLFSRNDTNWNPLFWGKNGWGSLQIAKIFSLEEREIVEQYPFEGKFLSLPDENEEK